jgi:hypothetical protein
LVMPIRGRQSHVRPVWFVAFSALGKGGLGHRISYFIP